jgi:hypothetical protein
MKRLKHGISERMAHQLFVVASVFFVLFGGYTAYSVGKYGKLSSRSLVQSTVVMRVIQHNVKCVCPRCGTKGVPLCPKCQVPTYWNGYQGTFVCSACGQGGFPQCPKCQAAMSWIEAQ